MKSCFKKIFGSYKNAARTVVRESVRSPELSSGRTWLSTERQSGRLLCMSTSPEKVMLNQERNNLARLQMLNALPYRLLHNLMNVQSEGEQIVEKSAASNFGNILTCSSKTEVRERT